VYLKRLNLLGFKSFANKTAVHFSSGMTAIVGPNGCGKTNILDALRWVLGEQKVSLLRGSKMEEVIFNGTREMKPLGMAEVTLTLINNRGILPIEYTEVQVTRRLFRSGESEYLLNKVPCRLKDIHELFFDTGMGAQSYSVIQQDMIEAVISDKAEERRMLFEEAAGITKYKRRKRAALRKLDATDTDLQRLKDIYAEVQTQVRSLNRQQKKAQRYQKIVSEIRDWDIYLGTQRVKSVSSEKRELMAEQDRLAVQRSEKETALNKAGAALESDRKEQVDLEHKLTELGNEVYEISEKAHTLEREVSILVEKRSNARTLIDRNREEILALKAREEILSEQGRQAEIELEEQREADNELKTKLSSTEAVAAEADRRLYTARSTSDDENARLLELEGKLSSGRTEEDNLKQQQTELKERIEDYRAQIDKAEQSLNDITVQLEKVQREEQGLTEAKEDLERRRQETAKRIEESMERTDTLSVEISNATASLEACQARRTLLEDVIVHYEGYSSGAVAVMEDAADWPGVAGTVADKFVPHEGWAQIVESALGELAGFLICHDRNTAEKIIGFLTTKERGKVGILLPDSGTLNPVMKRPEMALNGFLGWLDQFVDTDPELKPLMQAILSRIAVFKAGSNPDEILARLPFGFSAVSDNGTVYRQNSISGGSQDKYPLFQRKERLEEEGREAERLTQLLVDLKSQRDQLQAQQAADRATTSQIVSDLESVSEELTEVVQNCNELQFHVESLNRDLNRLQKERGQASDRLEQILNRQYSLELDSSQLASQKTTLMNSMSAARSNLSALENAASQASEELSRVQVQAVESRSKIDQIDSKLSHLKELGDELIRSVKAKEAEILQAERDIETSGSRIGELETDLKSVFASRSEATERQAGMRTSQAEIMGRVDSREAQLKGLRTEREALSDALHHAEIRFNSMQTEIDGITQRLREEYDVDVTNLDPARPQEETTDDQAREHLAQMKERLKKFGAVNLLALEEYQTAVERESFLKEQLDDLTKAKDDLLSTITKINRTARQLFNETFAKVKVNFQKLFVDLFKGGEADILLEDPSDPLESDIHIIARPRGKKLLSITMMSGGERALTAIALLFSLYLVKPSPFCILDEIDAPLDDANCRRFLNIIDKFSEQTQFIIITHNKITMEKAQNLYGVTMEKAGVSKLVAVKFTDVAESDDASALVDNSAGETEDESTPDVPTDAATETTADDKPVTGLPDNIAERLNSEVSLTKPHDPDNQA